MKTFTMVNVASQMSDRCQDVQQDDGAEGEFQSLGEEPPSRTEVLFPKVLGSGKRRGTQSAFDQWLECSCSWPCWPSCRELSWVVLSLKMRARRSERSLLRYWSQVGRLKESVQVVKFQILSRILDRRELLELPVLLRLLVMM